MAIADKAAAGPHAYLKVDISCDMAEHRDTTPGSELKPQCLLRTRFSKLSLL